jgi:SAM-dependent methyltransferase
MVDAGMITYACPLCGGALEADDGNGALRCARDGYVNAVVEGIGDFLTDNEAARHERFVEEYRAIREAEHRGSDDPAYYLALPDVPHDDPMRKEWALRKESASWLWEQLERWSPIGGKRILDAGAGNCWLTRWIAEWGNGAVALDLNIDPLDGLGAGRHYLASLPIRFDRVRADFAHLPFIDHSFDAVIFNGSFHYADDRGALIAEACRVTRPGGGIFIIDSPIYGKRASGEKMLAERAAKGRAGYLTFDELHDLAHAARLGIEIHRPYAGALSKAKRALTELRLGREIATMARVKFVIGSAG